MSNKSNKRRSSKRQTKVPIRFEDTVCDIGKNRNGNRMNVEISEKNRDVVTDVDKREGE